VILAKGTIIQIHQIKHERSGLRYPGVVLADDGDHLVLQAVWVHESDFGVAHIELGAIATEHYWRSRHFSIGEVRDLTGPRGWYCNVARPAELTHGAVISQDLELDVWISADWATHAVLDEDEFRANQLIARQPTLAAEARRATRFLSELTPEGLQQLLAT
jgi:protein associated with RNAse G/E